MIGSFAIMTEEQKTDIEALNGTVLNARVEARQIDNPLANNLGFGVLQNLYLVSANILVDPLFVIYYDLCKDLPIVTVDSILLFMPDPDA